MSDPTANTSLRPEALNPAQEEVLTLLGAKGEERPDFDAELRISLRATLEAETAEAAEELTATLHVAKHALASALGCEARFLAEREEAFTVSIPVARGTVAHKAIELSVHMRGEPPTLVLVDEAIARLTESEHWLAEFLQTSSEADLAELRSEANDRVSKFVECWPPLKAQWSPVTESAARVELHDSLIILRGKVDLTLGKARGLQAGKVLVDFKTGGAAMTHRDDLRFYALLETIRSGTPPRRLATYYLDQGTFEVEDVTVDLLESATRRTIDAIGRIVELVNGSREPNRLAGPPCRWCPLLDSCDTGTQWVAAANEQF